MKFYGENGNISKILGCAALPYIFSIQVWPSGKAYAFYRYGKDFVGDKPGDIPVGRAILVYRNNTIIYFETPGALRTKKIVFCFKIIIKIDYKTKTWQKSVFGPVSHFKLFY